jgi:hypothetical protein
MINLTENGGKHAVLGLQDEVVIAAGSGLVGRVLTPKPGKREGPSPV